MKFAKRTQIGRQRDGLGATDPGITGLEGGAASGNRTPDPRITNPPDTGPPLLTQSTRALPHRHLGTPCTPSATSACSSVHEPVHAAVGYRLDSASLAPAVAGSRWDVAQIQIADLCAGPCRREPQ